MAAGLLSAGVLRLAVQRIALGHWQPAGALRSWGVVPLLATRGGLKLPCFEGEALWLGAWLDGGTGPARVVLTEPGTGLSAAIDLPAQERLTALHPQDAAGGLPQPITRGAGPQRRLTLALHCDASAATLAFDLLEPARWAALAGREPPPPRTTPPPPPPRLG